MSKLFRKILTLVSEVNKQIADGEVRLLANSLSYSTLLSLIPFFAVSLSVFHAFGGLDKLYSEIEPMIMQNFASAAGKAALNSLQGLIFKIKPQTLGLLGFFGLLVTSTTLLIDMEGAVEKVWGVKEKRSFTLRIFFSWVFIFLGPLALASMLGALYSNKTGFFYLHKMYVNGGLLWMLTYFIYKYVPSERVHSGAAFFSAIAATLFLAVAQKLFSELTKGIYTYSKLYGSLATIPIFFLWISILWWIFLIGVSLCAVLNKKIAGRPITN